MHGAHIAAPCLTATDSFAKNAIVKKKSRKQPVWPRGCIHLIQQNFPSVSSLHSAGACEQLTLNVCKTLQFDLRLKLQHPSLIIFVLMAVVQRDLFWFVAGLPLTWNVKVCCSHCSPYTSAHVQVLFPWR